MDSIVADGGRPAARDRVGEVPAKVVTATGVDSHGGGGGHEAMALKSPARKTRPWGRAANNAVCHAGLGLPADLTTTTTPNHHRARRHLSRRFVRFLQQVGGLDLSSLLPKMLGVRTAGSTQRPTTRTTALLPVPRPPQRPYTHRSFHRLARHELERRETLEAYRPLTTRLDSSRGASTESGGSHTEDVGRRHDGHTPDDEGAPAIANYYTSLFHPHMTAPMGLRPLQWLTVPWRTQRQTCEQRRHSFGP